MKTEENKNLNIEGMINMYVYFRNGNMFTYQVDNLTKAREHAEKIWSTGFRTVISGRMEWFGPHYIDKVCWDKADGDYLSNKYL